MIELIIGLFIGWICGKLFYIWLMIKLDNRDFAKYELVYEPNIYQYVWKKKSKSHILTVFKSVVGK
jgi:hypothetical protein